MISPILIIYSLISIVSSSIVMFKLVMVASSPPFCSKFLMCSWSSRIYLSAYSKFCVYSLIWKFNLSISCVNKAIWFSKWEESGFSLNLSISISNYSILISRVLMCSSDFLKLSLLSFNLISHSALSVLSISTLSVLSISTLRVL